MTLENTTVLSRTSRLGGPSSYVPENSTLFTLSTVAFWVLLWTLRDGNDPTRKQDAIIFSALLFWMCLGLLQAFASSSLSPFSEFASATYSLAIIVTSGTGLAVIRALILSRTAKDQRVGGDHPWILPSRTTHTRMFPKKHSFAYSYLQVSIPVSFEGRCGSLISVGDVERKGWLHVQGSDYLDRSSSETTLEGKLSEYLQSQGVNRAEWHHAYLVTAPRILGYSFNPVSFWYVYTKENHLSTMVLEVNNTFDERRMYLLKSTKAEEVKNNVSKGESTEIFKNTWEKDFHVSPFNSREGCYSLTASDAFHNTSASPNFNNTIVMKSSKDHAQLVARVFSDGEPIDPTTTTFCSIARFLTRWGWVGFFTFPRILKEAFNLFFRRKLHVWLRPEVLPTSLSRMATSLEVSLEPYFMAYLQYLVEHSNIDLDLVYSSPTCGNKPIYFSSIRSPCTDRDMRTLEIQILSPAFFSRFVHYAHTSEAFDRECIFTNEKNRTILISRPELLPLLLKGERDVLLMATYLDPLNRFRWSAHRRIRCPPSSSTYPSVQQDESIATVKDIRMRSFSPMDRIVLRSGRAWFYRRQCMRLFLAQRLVLGFTPVIDLLDLSIRSFLIHLAISAASSSSHISVISRLNTVLLRSSLVHIFAYLKGTD